VTRSVTEGVPKRVFLVGFSGSGKSTVGKKLAGLLGWSFVDVDAVIAAKEHRSVPCIFAAGGERYFRRLERQEIERAVRRKGRAIIALGGGAFQSGANRLMIRRAGTVVYLSCSAREIIRRLRKLSNRPMLEGADSRKKRVQELLRNRKPYYSLADMTIRTTGKAPARVVREIRIMLMRCRDAR